jgi:hypothetical protein
MEKALEIQGSVVNGVLTTSFDRSDITGVTIHGTPIKPSFGLEGAADFQPAGNGKAFFNGDIPVKGSEINPVIDAILAHGLKFQAEHQHMYDFNPMVWFIHLRGAGDPVQLAKDVHAVLKATSTPLPQAPPANPTTPLNPTRLQNILHGYDAEVGSDGVVTVFIKRNNPVTIKGIRVKPETNISSNVNFEPLNSDGSQSAALPDFGMTTKEITPVMSVMRGIGWDIGCLYNQETGEHPQLYFSHQFKTGDPYALAAEIRKGLDHMNTP